MTTPHRRVLLFFGAGNSRPFGIPTMSEMLDGFRREACFEEYEALQREPVPPDYLPDYEKVGWQRRYQEKYVRLMARSGFSDFTRMHYLWVGLTTLMQHQSRNIETLLSHLHDTASHLMSAKVIDSQQVLIFDCFATADQSERYHDMASVEKARVLAESINALGQEMAARVRDFIKAKCVVPLRRDDLRQRLDPLFDAVERSGARWDVATTNYDTIIETFLQARHTTFLDGSSVDGTFDAGKHYSNHSSPWLVKFHGSIDLYETTSGFRRIPSPDVRVLSDGSRVGNVMIYPGKGKSMGLKPFESLFRQFRLEMDGCSKAIVVGYSFPDQHVLEVFKGKARRDKTFKVELVDPRASCIRSTSLRSIGDRVTPRDARAETLPSEEWHKIANS